MTPRAKISAPNAPAASAANAAAPAGARRYTYHHHDLRESLLGAALRLTEERGAPSFSLRELALELGVSHTATYRHFPGKAQLLDALAAEGFRRLAERQKLEQDAVGSDPLDRLYALGTAYVGFAKDNPGFFLLMFSHDLPPSEGSARAALDARAFETLTQSISACQKAGLLMQKDPERVASYLVLTAHGLACYSSQGSISKFARDYADPDFADRVTRLTILPLLSNRPSNDAIAALLG